VRKFLLSIALSFISVFLVMSAAWAREPATPEFTLQQAVDRALEHSEAVKKAQYDVDRAYELREFSYDDVKFVPQDNTASPEAEQNYIKFVTSDQNWQSAKKTYDTTKDSVVASVYQAYNAILQAQDNVALLEAQLKSNKEKLRIARIGYRVGTVNQSDLIQAETTAAGTEASLTAARKALDDAYQKFNNLVGLWPNDRPVLIEKPAVTPLVIDNLDTEVQRAIETSPSVFLANMNIDLAKLKENLYFAGDRSAISEPYEAKEIDIEKANVSLQEAKEKLDKVVRTLYYSILQYEEQYSGKLESKRMAEETLRVTKVKYEVGMATQAEVLAAEVALAQANKDLTDLACSHEMLTVYFRKPWTYS